MATFSDVEDASSATVDIVENSNQGELVITDRNAENGEVKFTVTGKQPSSAGQKLKVKAVGPVSGSGEIVISVVVPDHIQTPYPEFPQGVVVQPYLKATNGSTSPAAWGLSPGVWNLTVLWMKDLNITVLDQFGDKIGDIYAGAEISENGNKINQQLKSDSSYTDKVGYGLGAYITNTSTQTTEEFLSGSAHHTYISPSAWEAQNLNNSGTTTAAPITENFAVEVDGIILKDGVKNRKNWLETGNKVFIEWKK